MISDLTRTRNREGKEEEGDARGRRNHGGLRTPKVLESVQIPLLLRTVAFISSWEEWIEHRLECGRRYRWATSIRCFVKAMTKCEQWGPDRAVAAIDHSIEMGYRGLFEARKFHKEQKHKHVEGTIHTGVRGRIY